MIRRFFTRVGMWECKRCKGLVGAAILGTLCDRCIYEVAIEKGHVQVELPRDDFYCVGWSTAALLGFILASFLIGIVIGSSRVCDRYSQSVPDQTALPMWYVAACK